MEITLRIVISMMVFLAVGTTIITISYNLLTQSQEDINKIGDFLIEEKMIEKDDFTENEIKFLVQACYDQSIATKMEDLCFILRSSNDIVIPGSLTGLDFTYEKTTSSSSAKTLYINFVDGEKVTISD